MYHQQRANNFNPMHNDPLPPGWEMLFDQRTGWPFFVDHSNQSTTWQDPRRIGKPHYQQPWDPYGQNMRGYPAHHQQEIRIPVHHMGSEQQQGPPMPQPQQQPPYPQQPRVTKIPIHIEGAGSMDQGRGSPGRGSPGLHVPRSENPTLQRAPTPVREESPAPQPGRVSNLAQQYAGQQSPQPQQQQQMPPMGTFYGPSSPQQRAPPGYQQSQQHPLQQQQQYPQYDQTDAVKAQQQQQYQQQQQQQYQQQQQQAANNNAAPPLPNYESKPVINEQARAANQGPASSPQGQGQQNAPQQQPQEPPRPLTALEKIDRIFANVNELRVQVENFKGTRTDKQYPYLTEMLTRDLLELDGIMSDGDEKIRHARKNCVRTVQEVLDQLELKALANETPMETGQGQTEVKAISANGSPAEVTEQTKL
ncbi:BAG family molecular chaperone regulator 3-like [Lingula anatina]|uniref:BAG family molecular chaperone regulator 3-like n=1 Tax=Lingula anatina TaxID=7574 RepID=A0A1S3ISN6_LINAN|nr:BAG family molecular chaperone regulator 3-like [Lingula anatina]|eukprot:XP_013400951.1 BAG family molecular chaperone regulator 3-like [Lingula anatina]